MKRIKLFIGIAITITLFACDKKNSLNIPTFHIEKSLNRNAENLCDVNITATSIIPLETSMNALVGEVRKVIKSDNFIFIFDTNCTLKQFDLKGKYLRTIGRKGHGLGEYGGALTDFTINQKEKEIYINAIDKLLVHDFDGNFKREFSFKEQGKHQVFTCCNNKLFYIAPDKKHLENIHSATLISVFNTKGKLEKEFPANTLRKEEGFTMFNNIASDNKSVFYKEEFAQTVYAIRENYSVEPICLLDFGKYELKMNEFSLSKQKVWADRCRLQNILPADNYTIFMVQKGLMEPELIPFFWNKTNNSFYRFQYNTTYKGKEYSVFPFAIAKNQIVGILSDAEENLDADNPIVVLLDIKK